MTNEDLDQEAVPVKSSRTREEIVRELYGEDLVRPIEIIDLIRQRTNTSEGNFYESLRTLTEKDIIDKTSGEGRATLYSLTERGEKVAEHLGLNKSFGKEEEISDDAGDAEQIGSKTSSKKPASGKSGVLGAHQTEQESVESGAGIDTEKLKERQKIDDTAPPELFKLSLDLPEESSEERVNELVRGLRAVLMSSNATAPELKTAVDQVLKEAGGV